MINSGIAPKFPGIGSSQHINSVKSHVFTELVAIHDNELGKLVDFYQVHFYNPSGRKSSSVIKIAENCSFFVSENG